nr:hypothetical protein [Tanacetum cinerariifolium]
KPTRKDTQVSQPSVPTEFVIDKAVHKELGDRLVRAATTASSITKTQSKRKPTRKDTQVSQPSVPTEFVIDKAVHKELGDRLVRAATTASSITKTQSKRVESSGDEESLGEDASKQERRIDTLNADEDITLVRVQDDADKEMFVVDVLSGEEMFVAGQNENVVEEVVDVAQVSTIATTVTITTKEIILAQALKALKTSKPKDKGKGIIIEEPVKPKKKDQIRLDEEDALKLQAEFDEEERLAREKAQKEERANTALIEE